MNNNILAIIFLMAGTLLTTAVTTMVPAAYADNENEAEDESIAQQNDCDDNELNDDTNVNGEFCSNTVGPGPD